MLSLPPTDSGLIVDYFLISYMILNRDLSVLYFVMVVLIIIIFVVVVVFVDVVVVVVVVVDVVQ